MRECGSTRFPPPLPSHPPATSGIGTSSDLPTPPATTPPPRKSTRGDAAHQTRARLSRPPHSPFQTPWSSRQQWRDVASLKLGRSWRGRGRGEGAVDWLRRCEPLLLEYGQSFTPLYLRSPLSYAHRDQALKTLLPFQSRPSSASAGIRAPKLTTASPSQGSDHVLLILSPRAI